MDCEYCNLKENILNNSEPIMGFYEDEIKEGYIFISSEGKLLVNNDYALTSAEINYCPMCGRKLEES